MFNFQKEVVINSLDKAAMIEPGGDKKKGTPQIDKKVRFLDGGEYFTKYIVDSKIYYTQPIEGKNFELRIHPDEKLRGQHVQILIELGLDGDYRGDYGSALYYFRKPILVDVVLPKERAAAAATLAKAIQTVVPSEYEFVEVPYNPGDEDAVIKGVDSYQKVRRVVISIYTCDERCEGSSEELVTFMDLSGKALTDESATTVETHKYITYKPNNVEFGTYDYVLHNLRLPTYENLRFTSPSAPEMPIKGKTYIQYSFAYCVPRTMLGGVSAVGQTIHSTTLHTFYVLKDLNEAFKNLFKDAGLSDDDFVELGRTGVHKVTVLPDTFASVQDIKNAADIKANSEADKAIKKEIDEAKNSHSTLKEAIDAAKAAAVPGS